MAVKRFLPTREVSSGNSSGKRRSNSRSHDASCKCRLVCTNSVAQASANYSNFSCDQVPSFLTFFSLVCRYLRGRKWHVMNEGKKKSFVNEHPSELCRKGTYLSNVRSPLQNMCLNNAIRVSREQERRMVPPHWKRFPKVRTCFEVSVDGTNSCKMIAIISPWWINMNLCKIVKERKMSLVLLHRWGCDLQANYLSYRIRDIVPRGTKMSDYPCTFVDSPMLGEVQFCVPTSNPHQITGKSDLKKPRDRDRPDGDVEDEHMIIKRPWHVLQIQTYQKPQGKNVLKVRAFLVKCACSQVVGT